MNLKNVMFALAFVGVTIYPLLPLSAQMTGSRLGKNADAQDAQAVLDIMVQCVGSRNPKYAAMIMSRMPGSKIEHELIFGNAGDLAVCMEDKTARLVIPDNVELRMTARQFRTGLSRVLAQRLLRDTDPVILAEAPDWNTDLYVGDDGDQATNDSLLLNLFYFGDCVVKNNPSASANFVIDGPESVIGKQALELLVPELGPCLPDGAEVSLTPESLIIAISEPIYHRAVSLRSTASLDQD